MRMTIHSQQISMNRSQEIIAVIVLSAGITSLNMQVVIVVDHNYSE